MKSKSVLLLAACLPCVAIAGPVEIEPESLQNGLIAEYRSLSDQRALVHRIDAKPAFYLGQSSPHPRIPPGPFEVVWQGLVHIQDAAPLRFSAFVGGEVRVEIDGVTVLEGRGTTDRTEV